MTVHKIALVGAGRMGAVHARNAASSSRLELVAVADHNAEMAAVLAAQVGASVLPYDQILADTDIAGVIVASSTSSHLDNVRAAAVAGKAVMCEKPLSLDSGSLAAELARLEASKAPIFIGFNRRFDPNLRELKRRLASGEAGRIESIHIVNHDPAAPDPAFVPRSGGLFKDFTIHDFDTSAWLLEDGFAELFAAGSCLVDPQIGEIGDIDTAKLVLKSRSGALCLISNSRRSGCGYDQRAEVFGSLGRLATGNVRMNQVSRATGDGLERAPIPYSFAERYAEAYVAELDHFADIIEGREEPVTGPRDSLAALRLADAATESMASGKTVRLS